jgi:hypothetical protein
MTEWFSLEEAAADLRRAVKTVRNVLYRAELPRRRIRGPGRSPRIIVVISRQTLEELRRRMW